MVRVLVGTFENMVSNLTVSVENVNDKAGDEEKSSSLHAVMPITAIASNMRYLHDFIIVITRISPIYYM
jgi:hypothetical protein